MLGRWRRRIIIGLVLGAGVTVALTLWGDFARIRETLGRVTPWQVAALLGLSLASYLLRFVKWHLYCGALAIRVPVGSNLAIFLSGFTLTATPGKLGEVLKSFLLKETCGVAVSRTAPMVVAERLTDFTALLALTALGMGSFPNGGAITAVGLVVTCLALGAVSSRTLVDRLLAFMARSAKLSKWVEGLKEAYESMRSLVAPRLLAVATLVSIPAWFLECLELYLLLRWFGHPISLQAACFVYAGTSILGAVSMLPGGLGAMEGGMTALLSVVLTVPRTTAATATLLIRLTTLWFAVVLGAAVLTVFKATRVGAPTASDSTGPDEALG